MIYNQPIIEIIKQGAVAVEEIKFSPPKLQTLISSVQNGVVNKNGSPASNALKNKQILQLQGQQTSNGNGNGNSGTQQTTNSSIFSLNSLNPYYAQQVLCQFQKPHNFIKHVHVVVKNTPFGITMKSRDPQFNFHNYVIKATLLYDSDPPKQVDFIHNEPLQYVATVNEDGSEVCVEVKVGILSSQHQGSMFLAVLHISHTSVPAPSPNEPIMSILNNIGSNSLQNLSSSLPIYNLCVVSHPIRIVSKVDHVKKEGIPILKKKTFHEILTDKLKKLQKFQEGQSKWIKNLYSQHLIEFDMEPYCSKKESNNQGGDCDSSSSNSSTPSLSSTYGSHGSNKYNNNIHNHNHISNNNTNNDSSESDDDDDNDNDDDDNDDNDSDFTTTTTPTTSNNKLKNNVLLNNVKNQQLLQQQLLNHTTKQQSSSTSTPSTSSSSTKSTTSPIQQPQQLNQSNNFQNSFNRVVEAFKFVPENERKEIIIKMVEQLRSDDLEQLVSTFMDELGVNDNNSDTSSSATSSSAKDSNSVGCFCENCPSKKELEKFQGLCFNFLAPSSTSIATSATSPNNNNNNNNIPSASSFNQQQQQQQQLLYGNINIDQNNHYLHQLYQQQQQYQQQYQQHHHQSQMNNSISINNNYHHSYQNYNHHHPTSNNTTSTTTTTNTNTSTLTNDLQVPTNV